MDERRQHQRLAVTLPAEVTWSDFQLEPLPLKSANLSAGGGYFVTPSICPILAGQEVNLRIGVAPAPGRINRPSTLATRATVLRVDLLFADEPRLGLACRFHGTLRLEKPHAPPVTESHPQPAHAMAAEWPST